MFIEKTGSTAIMRVIQALLFTTLVHVGLAQQYAASARSGEPFTTESLSFRTNAVPGTTNDRAVEISATLYLPKIRKGLFPAVVIVPSSSGVEDEREVYYARQLTQAGIAALIVDSLGSRNIADTLYDQSLLDAWDVENDAIAALLKLAEHDLIDADRIAVMGVSKGGSAAMNTALKIQRKWMGIRDVEFAAHIAISPDCTWTTRNAATTGRPIFFMLAEFDDQTPAKFCLEQADRIRRAGNKRVATKVYDGAHHAWEELGKTPTYDEKTENYSRCRVWVEDNGRMVSAETGEELPEKDWHSWAQKNCMTLGATCCGGTVELKEKAALDIIAFLRRWGF